MEVDLGQDARQEHKISPKQLQGLELLQASRLDLVTAIAQELESNPALEEGSEAGREQEDFAEEGQSANREESTSEVTIDEKTKEDFDWENYLGEYSSASTVRMEREERRELPTIESRLAKKPSLDAHLLLQLHLSSLNEAQKEVGTLIIGNLGRDGFLEASLAEIADMGKCDEDCVVEVLKLIQEFDPVGVAARDLQECLLIQAKNLKLQDDLVINVITNHLHDLENRNSPTIVKATGRCLEDIQGAIDIISGLVPKPGKAHDEEDVQYISPDICIYKVDNEFVIDVNVDGMPKLHISPFYREAPSKDGEVTGQAREYIQRKLHSARWLIKSIHQRQRTVYRLAESIVKFQRKFFEHGIAHLRPLKQQEVAKDIGMHESTISRATDNKYMQTPHGLFELKYFFAASIHTPDGPATTPQSVKERIKQIVRDENPQRPYSDRKITEILESEGFEIDRRTVANYRQKLRILPYNQRKQPIWSKRKAACSG